MINLIEKLLLKNRTIVSEDDRLCMDIVAEEYPLEIHAFPTGSEYQSWPIPPEWNVKKAELRLGNDIIASYEESLLFLAPYSMSFSGTVSKEELIEHTYTNPKVPDAFCYEFRLAYNFQRRLKEWRITLPHDRLMNLPDGEYQVEIDIETKPGNMLIGESSHPGTSGHWFTFLAHYCHPAQANDGIVGVAVMLETLDRIRKQHPNSHFGYKALIMPETIGSSVYAATHEAELDNTVGGVFTEMAGADESFQFVFSRRGDTYIDRVFLATLKSMNKLPCRMIPFRKGWGNDELVFDAPGVGVPVVSLDRYPYEAYHTHHDNLELVHEFRLEEMIELLLEVVNTIETDYIPQPKNRVPVYLTRFELYSDWTTERDQYDINILLLDSMWSGLSTLDIALKHNLAPKTVREYLDKFVEHDLIDKKRITPEYTREVRFHPTFLED